jgi:transposase
MSLKVRPPWPMPAETADVGKGLLKEESPYKLVGDQLFYKIREQDFADLYSIEGKPGISPVILAFVSVFQFMEKLPDRQAAEAMRMRMDWKYALHLPLKYEGFDFSVLSEFRDRLLKHDAEGWVFDTLVNEFREMGLIKERGKQRSDSMAMLSKVRKLSRLEMMIETLRLAVGAIVRADRAWGEMLIPPSWEEMYGERFVMQRYSEQEWRKYEERIGSDGQWLLERLEGKNAPAEIRDLPEVQVLKTVWAQQFRESEGKIAYQELKRYDGHTQIQTPHDPEARYGKKRYQEWLGAKVQLTETDDEDRPHLITDITVTNSARTDYEELADIQERLAERNCLPASHYADSGYLSGSNLANSQAQGIDLIGPLAPVITPQDRLPDGITWEQFEIDLQNGRATCPGGHSIEKSWQNERVIRFKFPDKTCQECSLCPRCCTGKGGRTLGVSPFYEHLRVARARQETDEFKQDYHKHRSGVEGSLSALIRGNGLRVSRYVGQRKRYLQAVFIGCSANLQRVARWQAGLRPQSRNSGWGLTPAN